MKHILAIAFITLLALGTGCAWISPSSQTTSSDGINVHGHWTVTVTNPDGSVDAVHEFENELTGGKFTLAKLLSKDHNLEFPTDNPEGWAIGIFPAPEEYQVIFCEEMIFDITDIPSTDYTDNSNTILYPDTFVDFHSGGASFNLSATCNVINPISHSPLRIRKVKTYNYPDGSAFHFSSHEFTPYLEVRRNQRVSISIGFTFE